MLRSVPMGLSGFLNFVCFFREGFATVLGNQSAGAGDDAFLSGKSYGFLFLSFQLRKLEAKTTFLEGMLHGLFLLEYSQ